MSRTYDSIVSTTLIANAGSITFSSIPGTYTDLVLVLRPVNYGTGNMLIRFNGDTANNYSRTALAGTGSSTPSGRLSNVPYFGWDFAGSGINGPGGVLVAHIMSYANTGMTKAILGIGGHASLGVDRTVGLWRSTSAITSLTVTGPTNFAPGTVMSLYGIKAA
jgi:hypothetical protein